MKLILFKYFLYLLIFYIYLSNAVIKQSYTTERTPGRVKPQAGKLVKVLSGGAFNALKLAYSLITLK